MLGMYRNKKILWLVATFLFFLGICSTTEATNTIYWGLPPVYSSFPGNIASTSLSMLTARAYGAYAFTDYASSWGLNNLASMGQVLGLAGSGMGLGLLNLYNTWGQMYPAASMFGYSSSLFGNPWMSYSGFPTYPLDYTLSNYSLPMQSYYPLNNYFYNFPTIDFPQWAGLNYSPLLTTTATDVE